MWKRLLSKRHAIQTRSRAWKTESTGRICSGSSWASKEEKSCIWTWCHKSYRYGGSYRRTRRTRTVRMANLESKPATNYFAWLDITFWCVWQLQLSVQSLYRFSTCYHPTNSHLNPSGTRLSTDIVWEWWRVGPSRLQIIVKVLLSPQYPKEMSRHHSHPLVSRRFSYLQQMVKLQGSHTTGSNDFYSVMKETGNEDVEFNGMLNLTFQSPM